MAQYSDNPIIIIGAGRSGTKLLRSIISNHRDLVAIPKEINYLWRYCNYSHHTDELQSHHASFKIRNYIRKRFNLFSKKNNYKRIIEKTCANTLRVNFIRTIFPRSFFIHIIRDGRAVCESARRCWTAPLDIKYLWQKLLWIPTSEIPYYALRYIKYQFGRIYLNEKRQLSWGPRFCGIDKAVHEMSLTEVCALQWQACLKATEKALTQLETRCYITVHYEDLIENPIPVTERILKKANISMTSELSEFVSSYITKKHKEKWRSVFSKDEIYKIEKIIELDLMQYGYQG